MRLRLPAAAVALRWWMVALVGITACAPSVRVYSTVPVDREGRPLDVALLDLVLLEDGTRRPLLPGESLSLIGQSFVIEGPPRTDGTRASQSIAVDAIESVRQTSADGTQHWIEVRTPRDLATYTALPRIQWLETSEGERVDIANDRGRSARWSEDRLAIEIVQDGSDPIRSIALDAIGRVELFAPDLVGSTLKSPVFWIVGAAAAGLAIWIADAQDDESLAIR